MWRDPLDELIDDLERTLPPEPKRAAHHSDAALVGLQLVMNAAIWGTPKEAERVSHDPRVKAFQAQTEAWLRQHGPRPSTPPDNRAERQDPNRP